MKVSKGKARCIEEVSTVWHQWSVKPCDWLILIELTVSFVFCRPQIWQSVGLFVRAEWGHYASISVQLVPRKATPTSDSGHAQAQVRALDGLVEWASLSRVDFLWGKSSTFCSERRPCCKAGKRDQRREAASYQVWVSWEGDGHGTSAKRNL